MTLKIDGIVPVMLTPFNDVGQVDYEGLANLTEWYLNNGADALFAVCQSSEMQFLSLQERLKIGNSVSSLFEDLTTKKTKLLGDAIALSKVERNTIDAIAQAMGRRPI